MDQINKDLKELSSLIESKNITLIQLKLYKIYDELKRIYESIDLKKYQELVFRLRDIEDKLTHLFVIDYSSGLSLKDVMSLKTEQYGLPSSRNLLNDIVIKTRKMLIKNLNFYKNNKKIEMFDELDLTNMCLNASCYVKELCDELGFSCDIFTLTPGFMDEDDCFFGGYHCFCIVGIGFKNYIVDVTYKQFFSLFKNNINRLGVVGFTGCNPGVFMMRENDRANVAYKIIKDGFIELNSLTLKCYLDGFALSYRNGLYYDDEDYPVYETNYDYNKYKDFIYGFDNQLRHENIKWFGIQLKPLKDINKRF